MLISNKINKIHPFNLSIFNKDKNTEYILAKSIISFYRFILNLLVITLIQKYLYCQKAFESISQWKKSPLSFENNILDIVLSRYLK
jgi:hypothetical protein